MLVMEKGNFTINKKKIFFKKISKKKIKIHSYPVDYEIIFDKSFSQLKSKIKLQKSYFILDKNIYEKYINIFTKLKKKNLLVIEAKENTKTEKSVKRILNFFVQNNISKSNIIYCLGGGIIQDLSGFACCIYKRGIPWIYYPTTLLGMTDSCVGGKVGVNFKKYKNLIALFSAPKQVIVNLTFLNSLKEEEIISGLGESLRLHITGGPYFLKQFDKNIDKYFKNYGGISELIYNSLLVKKAVVEKDEYELDIRRAMNFGHSFGHALEYLSKNKISHGLCVTIGMCIEMIVGYEKKIIKDWKLVQKILDRSLLLLKNKKINNILKNTKISKINDVLKKDKKTLNNKIILAIPYQLGKIGFFPLKLNSKSTALFEKAKKKLIICINEK